ncbi:hypothetical protein [Aurantimicrobium minutum]|uniref:hypothetical protein n=1 Tax=Aurantimicrobium minutum TaxID=708131 RepID=UPI00248DAD02|nr:hypothetical protein [Aurantimicrobium minutum]
MQELKEKAPVKSGNSDEGIYPNITKGIDMSHSLTQTQTVNEKTDTSQLTVTEIAEEAKKLGIKPSEYWGQIIEPNIKAGLSEFSFKEPTLTEVAYAEKFSDYTLRTSYVNQPEVHYKGEYRFYGRISVVPSKQEFVLNVFEGATSFDYRKLEAYVQKVKDGFWNSIPWQEKISQKFGYSFHQVILGDTAPIKGDRIYPCTEERCEEYGGHHLVDRDDPTELPIHYGDILKGKNYYVQLRSEKPGEWCLDTEIFCDLTVTEAASYASDLMWLAAEAKKLNNDSIGR